MHKDKHILMFLGILIIFLLAEETFSHDSKCEEFPREKRSIEGINSSSDSNEDPTTTTTENVRPMIKIGSLDGKKGGSNDCVGAACGCSPQFYCSSVYTELLKEAGRPLCEAVDEKVYEKNCGRPFKDAAADALKIDGPTSRRGAPGQTATFLVSDFDALKGVDSAIEFIRKKQELEKKLQSEGLAITDRESAEFGHFMFFLTAPEAYEIAKIAFVQERAAKSLKNELDLTTEQVKAVLPKGPLTAKLACPPIPVCTEATRLVRTFDGSCNNLDNPNWGKAMTAYGRMGAANYFDGISVPRKSVLLGKELTSARVISTTIATDLDFSSHNFTLGLMQFGQLMDHDMTQAPISRFDNASGIQCCSKEGNHLPPEKLHPECFPIDIPSDDNFYAQFTRRCLNFVRSIPAPNDNCDPVGPRNQMNSKTHFLDASAIYGNSLNESLLLREFARGLLKVAKGDMLMDVPSTTGFDFLAGDLRVNTHPHLAVIHTLWTRQHNFVAKKLIKLNPAWNDEKLFQETRKIIIAQYQHIVYNEWLLIVLGKSTMEKLHLLSLKKGFLDAYARNLNPNIRNEFSSAGFRIGHSMAQGTIGLYSATNKRMRKMKLGDCFNQPSIAAPSAKFKQLLRGLYMQPMQDADFWVVHDLTRELFKPKSQEFGLDLVAFNIQRGRDHGIGSYNQIRALCGLTEIKTFAELKGIWHPRLNIKKVESVYASVNDIDAFIGVISELSTNDGIVGPTCNCLIREQFFRLKFGDRFYYENGGMPTSFTEDQLNEIRKCTWATIVCDNEKSVTKLQPEAFRLPNNSTNSMIPCNEISKYNLNPWKEK